jgi:tRNA(Arg) A34 adenosine deaminase TadA
MGPYNNTGEFDRHLIDPTAFRRLSQMNPDDLFLRRTLELARQGSDSCEGGPFGAVLVRDGKIIAEGWNRVIASRDPTAHAEINVIRAACAAAGHFHLPNATLYASSEPCPMCLSAAYWARIGRIVFANSRAEAAAIGFCDDELYAELTRHFTARSIVMEHHPLPGALMPLQHWFGNPKRTCY